MTRVRTNDANDPVAPNDLALSAHALYGCGYFHGYSPIAVFVVALLGAENYSAFCQIVRSQLNGHLVSGKNPDVVHAHLPRNMTENNMTVI